jgi:hypothetical protein
VITNFHQAEPARLVRGERGFQRKDAKGAKAQRRSGVEDDDEDENEDDAKGAKAQRNCREKGNL